MTNVVKNFYENQSLKGKTKEKGLLGWLFYKLERFSTSRVDAVLKLISNISKKSNIDSVCDIGCSRGLLLKKIIGIIPTTEYISGIDIDEKILEEARSNVKGGDFYSCDINEPFELHKKCDLITCLAVLEHVFNPESVFKNISQNVNKGGYLIIQVPNIVCITRRIGFLFGNRPRTSRDAGRDGGHIAYFTKKDVVNLFKDNGFEIIKITGSGVFANLRNWWVSMLSPDIIIIGRKY